MAGGDTRRGARLWAPLEIQAGEGKEPAWRAVRSGDESVGNGPHILETGLYWDDTDGGVVGSGSGMEGTEGVEVRDGVATI